MLWDIERNGSSCSRCGAVIGAGEAFRRSQCVVNRKICEGCSIAMDGTPAPHRVRELGFAERMRADIALSRDGGKV